MCDCNFYDMKLFYFKIEVILYVGEVGLLMDVEFFIEI